MRFFKFVLIVAFFLLPLVTATEITGTLSTNVDAKEEIISDAPDEVQATVVSSGGGGGGGAARAVVRPPAPDVNEVEEFDEQSQRVVNQGQPPGPKTAWEFLLDEGDFGYFGLGSTRTSIQVIEFDEESVEFKVGSLTERLRVHTIRNFDVNSDGIDDLSVYYRDYKEGKAWVRVKDLSAPGSFDGLDSLTGATTGVVKVTRMTTLSLVGLAVLIVLGGIYVRRRRNS